MTKRFINELKVQLYNRGVVLSEREVQAFLNYLESRGVPSRTRDDAVLAVRLVDEWLDKHAKEVA